MNQHINPIQEVFNPVEQIVCPACGSGFSSLTKFCPNDGQALFTTQAISHQLIPNYEFTGEIGSGGMGVVYKAVHVVLKKPVAIKVLPIHQLDQVGIKRFQQEARAASLLRHDNLVAVTDCGVTVTGQPYMIMDFVDGKTLQQLLKEKGSLSEHEALPIFEQICQAVEHAHDKGILHRDLKPSNIMLIDAGAGESQVKVLDFGIAKILHGDLKLTQGLTLTGVVFGSPPYMSPEQAMGQTVDCRSDIYALGCVMYEALTGAPPLLGAAIMETIYKHIHEKAPSLSEGSLGRKFSADWEDFMATALAKEPGQRFQSVAQMRHTLPFPGRRASHAASEELFLSRKGHIKARRMLMVSFSILIMIAVFAPILRPVDQAKPHSLPVHELETASPSRSPQESPSLERFWGGYAPDQMADQMIKNSTQAKLSLSRTNGEPPITDYGIEALRSRSNITELILYNDKISDKGVDYITHLPLQSLDLSATCVSDAGLRKVSLKIATLRDLVLNDMKISDAGIGYISHLPQLNRLCANRIEKLSEKALSCLGKTRTLTSLELTEDRGVTTEGLAHLQNLKLLKYLNLRNTGADDRCGSVLKQLTSLSGLNLAGTDVADRTIADLAKLKLSELNVSSTKISGCSAKTLGDMTSLTRLDLGGIRALYDRDLENLTRLPNLAALDLSACKTITDSGMRYLIAIKSLRTLNLSGTSVTSNGLAQLAQLPDLHDLNVSHTGIDDQGIQILITLPLRRLDLSNTRITGAGFVKLGQMKSLSELTVTHCRLHASDQIGFRREEKKVRQRDEASENEACLIEPEDFPP